MNSIARKLLMDILAKPKARKIIEERASKGLCIIEGCDCEFVSRGLCQSHINMFFGQRRAKSTDEERLEYENHAIREGFILPVGEQAKYRNTDNPFKKIG